MPTFLVFSDNNGIVTIEKMTWKNPPSYKHLVVRGFPSNLTRHCGRIS